MLQIGLQKYGDSEPLPWGQCAYRDQFQGFGLGTTEAFVKEQNSTRGAIAAFERHAPKGALNEEQGAASISGM